MQKFLALDASSSKTGWALFENGVHREHGLIDKSHHRDLETRLAIMSRAILDLINDTDPDAVVIEDTTVIKSITTMRMLTRLQGVVYAACLMGSRDFEVISPSVWRKFAGVSQGGKKREELKKEALEIVRVVYGIDCETDDVAEAILIGQAVVNRGYIGG